MSIIDRRGIVVGEDVPSVASADPSANLAIKTPVRVATTANVTLNGLQTVDGVTVAADDRVLVKDQTDATQNGIYLASTGNWIRTTDFDSVREAVRGTVVLVNSGTTQTSTIWGATTADPITPGTSSLAFSNITSASILAAVATQAEAEAGTINTKLMSPLRTKQAIQNGTFFTQTGTGAVARTIPAKLKDIVSVKDFGAVGDDSTDNTAAFTAAALAAAAAGGALYIPGGTYRVASAIDVSGVGLVYGDGQVSTIIKTTSATANVFTKNSAIPTTFQGFRLTTTVAKSAGAYIVLDGGAGGDKVIGTNLQSPYIGIQINSAVGYKIDANDISEAVALGIYIRNTTDPDAGDSFVTNNTITSSTGNLAGIQWESGGGPKFIGNKINGAQYGILVNPAASSTVTSVFIIVGNSIEGQTQFSIAFNKSAGTTTLSYILIANNQLGGARAVLLGGPATTWLSQVAIHSNIIEYTSGVDAINMGSGRFVSIAENSFYSTVANTTAIVTAAAWPQSLSIGHNTFWNTNSRYSLSGNTGVTYVDLSEIGPITATRLVGNPLSASGNLTEITIDAGLVFDGVNAVLRTAAFTGDVTKAQGGTALTLATAQPAVHTWALAQTFTLAPVFTDASGSRTALGLGALATVTPGASIAAALAVNVGTDGAPVIKGGALGSPSSAGTLPAHTLGGTVSGGGNAIENVNIGASTAGTLRGTTINGTSTTDASSPTVAGTVLAGGFATAKKIWGGSSLVVNALSANITDSGFVGSAIVGAAAKATAATGGFIIVSDDAANQFQGTYQFVGSATAANRRLLIQAIESGVAFRNVSLAESGGAVAIGIANGLVTAGYSLEVASGIKVGGPLGKKVYTVATLPSGNVGDEAFVSDANATLAAGIGAAPVSGGTNKVPVFYDTAWKIG